MSERDKTSYADSSTDDFVAFYHRTLSGIGKMERAAADRAIGSLVQVLFNTSLELLRERNKVKS